MIQYRVIFQILQDRADKICEMANVMQKSIQIDEESINKEQELLARLVTENKVTFLFDKKARLKNEVMVQGD